jgi:hypothetical protein
MTAYNPLQKLLFKWIQLATSCTERDSKFLLIANILHEQSSPTILLRCDTVPETLSVMST